MFSHVRYFLTYHSPEQVLWGLGIGSLFGTTYYVIVELIPRNAPLSFLGRIRTALLRHPICAWLRIRDGWAVWSDGGIEEQWLQWRAKWEKKYLIGSSKDKIS